jgi:hypothetical protein
MLHEYHVIYSVRHYPRFHITAVGLGTYYPWIRGHICIEYRSVDPEDLDCSANRDNQLYETAQVLNAIVDFRS